MFLMLLDAISQHRQPSASALRDTLDFDRADWQHQHSSMFAAMRCWYYVWSKLLLRTMSAAGGVERPHESIIPFLIGVSAASDQIGRQNQ